MAFFSRRRLQAMVDELRPLLQTGKVNDILARLSDRRPEQALGAEMELGLLWGIQQVADLQVEPALPNSSRRPEALSRDLFGRPSFIEITTLSDGKLSGESAMQRAASKVVAFANTFKKGCGKQLFFTFRQIQHWEGNHYTRKHGITSGFELDEELKAKLTSWVSGSSGSNTQPLSLKNDHIDVVVEFKTAPQRPGFNFFSSLPALAYDIEQNPMFAALKEKAQQLSGVPDEALKVIFLADGGSRVLRRLRDRDPLLRYKSGVEIIQHFLNKYSVQVVCLFSPARDSSFFTNSRNLFWQVSLFLQAGITLDQEKIRKLALTLPAPRLEGYQARSLHKQGVFEPGAKRWYLPTKITFERNLPTMKISALLLQECLAGKVSRESFERSAFGERNYFSLWLGQGYTISKTMIEPAGLDEDDDYVIFEFAPDPAASPLK